MLKKPNQISFPTKNQRIYTLIQFNDRVWKIDCWWVRQQEEEKRKIEYWKHRGRESVVGLKHRHGQVKTVHL